MKKMMIALIAMVMMTMSVNAQSDNMTTVSFDRISNFLELRIDQVEPMKTAMEQFNSSMEAYYQLDDVSKGGEAWEKIQARHKATIKKILDVKQYDKYVKMLDLTVKNTADRIKEQLSASK